MGEVLTMRDTDVLNFVVAGQVRSGAAVVQSTVDNLGEAVCHANLLHPNEKTRRRCHESYFGASRLPEYFIAEGLSPHKYLNHQVFDQNKLGEKAVGLRIPYDPLERYDLYDLLHERCMEGDFCVVHVDRNPVACFVSLKQAESTTVWNRSVNEPVDSTIPCAVHINPQELTAFVRRHLTAQTKLTNACDDALVVTYRELVFEFQKTMRKIGEFLELDTNRTMSPITRRMRNRSMRERISNFQYIREHVPNDVRGYMDDPDLL